MTSYLEDGWYAQGTSRARLRTAVIDGAMDVAGMLHRANVPAHRVLRLALKVRSLVVISDPLMRGTSRFGERDRARIADRLFELTDGFPELQGFVNDCLDHVSGARDMTAFYLHLVHITRMMQLLARAATFAGLLSGESGLAGLESHGKKATKKKATKKKTTKKKTTKKKATKKKATKKKATKKKASPRKR